MKGFRTVKVCQIGFFHRFSEEVTFAVVTMTWKVIEEPLAPLIMEVLS